MKVNREKTRSGVVVTSAVSQGLVLDQEVEYGFEHGDDMDVERLTVTAGQYILTTDDSPATSLGQSGANRKYDRVEVDEEYRMYLMFQPGGGIAVALAEVVWRWHAQAVFESTRNAWVLTPGAHATEQKVIQKSLRIARILQWSGNAADTLEADH